MQIERWALVGMMIHEAATVAPPRVQPTEREPFYGRTRMEAIARIVRDAARDGSLVRPTAVDDYLAFVRDEQHRYLAAVSEATGQLGLQSGQTTNVAALHGRLTQQLFDAQRLILKRRVDAHAEVVRIAVDAENEVDAILQRAHGRSSDELGIWSASDGLARAIDLAFDRAADEVVLTSQLRQLLDEWWRLENQEDQAAIDDANARAAMRIHLAEVEAREIGRLSVDGERHEPIPLPPPISLPVPVISARRPLVPPVHMLDRVAASELAPKLRTEPMLAALDDADHEDLDAVLASLLDTLAGGSEGPDRRGRTSANAPGTSTAAPIVELAPLESGELTGPGAQPDPSTAGDLRIRCDVAEIEHVKVGQESFDRFWGAFGVGSSKPFSRDWMLVQVMLPAVGVVAVMALVLAWVG